MQSSHILSTPDLQPEKLEKKQQTCAGDSTQDIDRVQIEARNISLQHRAYLRSCKYCCFEHMQRLRHFRSSTSGHIHLAKQQTYVKPYLAFSKYATGR